jgi:hypothetical protein
MNIAYSQYAFLALSKKCEMRMGQIVICGLSGSTTFFNIVLQTAGFPKKKKLQKIKYFGFSLQFCPKYFLFE